MSWPSVLGSLSFALLGLGAQTLAFRAVLADLGHPVTTRTAGKIYLVGLLGKYLPGSVWTFVMQMELGRRAGIPRARALLAPLVCLAISTSAAVVLGLLGLPALGGAGVPVMVGVGVIALAAIVCAHPRVLTWLIERFLVLTRRPPLPSPITWHGVGVCFAWSAVAWACFGAHLWLLTDAAGLAGVPGLLICVGAFALGLTGGIVAFLAPSGLGVRESVIAAMLLPYVPVGVALGVALTSRLIFTVADVIAAGAAALSGSRVLARSGHRLQAAQAGDTAEW